MRSEPSAGGMNVSENIAARVQVGDNYYSHANLTVGPEDVTVKFTNVGRAVHSVTVDQGADEIYTEDLQPGDATTLSITRLGEYGIRCRYHPEMVASLEVVGPR